MKEILELKFEFEKETKEYYAYKLNESKEKQLFFPKKVYVGKSLIQANKPIILTIREA